jgi:hypothetical protein
MAATIQNIELPKKPRALDSSTSVQEVSQELVTNGSMEADANWSNQNTPTTNERSSAQANGGTYSRKVVGNSSGDGIKSDTFSLVEGRTYRVEFYYYLTSSSNNLLARLQDGDGSDLGVSEGFGTKDAWTKITFTRVAESTGDASYFKIYQNQGGSSTFYVDDVSVKEIDTFSNNNHGKIYSGRALEFDGVSDYLDTGYIASAQGITNDITVACWLKTTNAATSQFVFNFYQSTSDAFGLKINSSNIFINNDVDNVNADVYETGIFRDTWYRAVVVIDSLQMKLYLNGVLVGSGSSTADGLDSFTSNLYIGNRKGSGGSSPFTGMMSDFQVWGATWSADDVAYDFANPESLALNASGTALTEGNLKVWYPMQDGHRGQQSYILDGANTGLGDDIAVNGTFDSDLSGWTVINATGANQVTWVDGKARLLYDNAVSTNALGIRQSLLTAGTQYKVTFDIIVADGTYGAAKFYNYTTETATGLGTGSHAVYFTAVNSHFSIYRNAAGTDTDLTIDNVVVKAINDKHHATTVFTGDEMITEVAKNSTTFSGHNWQDLNITGTTVAVSGQKLVVVTDDGSSQEEGISLAASLIDGPNQDHPVTIGRTYRVSADLQNTAGVTTPSLQFAFGGASSPTFTITASEVTYTKDIVATADGNSGSLYIKHMGSVETGTTTFTVDNISVKEIGVASGWTDADQQLDIAQPALQSYNEMAYFTELKSSHIHIAPSGSSAVFNASDGEWNSISCWMCSEPGSSTMLWGVAGSRPNLYRLSDSSNYKIGYNTGNGDVFGITIAKSLVDNKWNHWVMNWKRNSNSSDTAIDTSDVELFLNGVKQTLSYVQNTNSNAASTIAENEFTLFSGSRSSNYQTVGTGTEFSVWKYQLTAADVLELYNDGKALDALTHSRVASLSGYWRNNGISRWMDLSGKDNHEDLEFTNGSCDTTDGDKTVTHNSTNAISVGLGVSGTGIQNGSYVASKTSETEFELSRAADATATDATLTFTRNIDQVMLIPQGVDGSRDTQGFIMNRARNTSSLNLPSTTNQRRYGQNQDAYVEVSKNPTLAPTGNFSLECWVKPQYRGKDANADDAFDSTLNTILNLGGGIADNDSSGLGCANNLKFYFYGPQDGSLGDDSAQADSAGVVGQWYHVVGVKDGTGAGGLKLYVDGAVQSNTGQSNDVVDNSHNMIIGGEIYGDGSVGRRYEDEVDAVKVYSKALSAAEVLRNYKATKGSHRN